MGEGPVGPRPFVGGDAPGEERGGLQKTSETGLNKKR